MYFFDLDHIQAKMLIEGVTLKTVHGEKIMMAFFDVEPGGEVPHHHHEHEQMGLVLSGELTLHIGDETKLCRAGDAYLIPPNVPHSANVPQSGSAVKVLDIFSPPREEYT